MILNIWTVLFSIYVNEGFSLFNYVDFNAFIYFNLGELNILLGETKIEYVTILLSKEEWKKNSYLVTPSVTLAGTASGLIQNEIQDMITIRQVGTYVWNR